MSNRHQRRASVAAFKREARTDLMTYLIAADEPLDLPLLCDAVAYWRAGIQTRKPTCIGCRASFASFAGEAKAGAFLLATPVSAPTSASVSAFCDECWRDLSGDEVEAIALRVLRKALPRGRFA